MSQKGCRKSLVTVEGEGTSTLLVLNIAAPPIAQPAPRYHSFPRGDTRIYNAAQKQQNNLRVALCQKLGLRDGELFFKKETGWIQIEVLHFFFRRPEYHFLSHRSRCYENLRLKYKKEQIPFIHKPDIDNLEKFLFDVFEGVIYSDDKMVCQVLDAAKYYDCEGNCNGRTHIKIRFVDE
jgi:hypothetical protein